MQPVIVWGMVLMLCVFGIGLLSAVNSQRRHSGTFVKKVVCADESWPYVQISTGAWLMLKARISGVIEALAAVRAHDAGTDERKSRFICAAWRKRVEGPMDARRTLVNRCDLSDGHDGKHLDHVLLVSWADDESAEECRPRNEWNKQPASHAAESAPPEPEWRKCPQCKRENSFASWEMNLGKCPNCDDLFSKESAPQLDAKDPAEPGEDAISRMCKLMGGCACEHCIKRMTASLAVAREGYVKLEDVEKAIRAVWKEHYHSQAVWSKEEFLSKLMARLAPKPSPRQETDTRMKWEVQP